jgi:hypothetical protein
MDYSKLTVAELKKHIREYKHIHCKPYSKLKRAGLEALAKEFEHHLKMDSKLNVRKEAHKLILKRSGPIMPKEAKEAKAAGKKAPTEKQLEARRKFVEMVRAKSAGKKALRSAAKEPAAPKEPMEPMEPKAKAPRARKPKGERVAKAVARLEPVSDANKVIEKQKEASKLIVSAMTGRKNA